MTGALIAGARQGLGGLVDFGYPPTGGHDPLTVINTAHIGLIGKLASSGDPGDYLAVYLRRLHLPEVSGDDAEGHHELRHALVGGKTQRGGRGVQHIVLLSGEVVRQNIPVLSAEIGPVHDLVIAGNVIGSSYDPFQPHRLGR